MPNHSRLLSTKRFLHDCLGRHEDIHLAARLIRVSLIVLIALNILAFVLQTLPELATAYRADFESFRRFSMLVFSIELIARIALAPMYAEGIYNLPVRGRLRFLLSPLVIADVLVLLPFYLSGSASVDLRFLRSVRFLWFLNVTHHLPAIGALGRVMKRERKTLLAVMLIMLTMLFIASSLVYLLEHNRQPERFASIPHAMWWGMATLTTVGYGDVVPVSPMGRVLGVVIMLLGVGTFAMPAGILASAFSEERKRRDFMLTWNLVARVPLFSALNAQQIADITLLLRPVEALPNEVIFHKDDLADSMYFIVTGELEVELSPSPRRLGASEYFGELGLLYHRPRTATVVVIKRAEMLELDARDLHQLFERKPQLRHQIMSEAERRLAADRASAESN